MGTIGSKIKNRRLELGLTLEQIGEHVGVGKSTVRKWETGDIANIKRDKIALLAEILKISPMELIDENYKSNTEDKKAYYLDEETAAYAQEIANNKDLKMLFDATKNIKKEDMQLVYEMIKRFKDSAN